MKRKILFVISTMDAGGAARIVGNITSNLSDDWEIDILVNNSESIAFPYKGRLISLKMSPSNDRTRLLYQLIVFIKRILLLIKLKKTGEYQCCVSLLDSSNIANILTRTNNCKTIIYIVNVMTQMSKYSAKYRLFVDPMIRFLYNKADAVVPISNDVGQDIVVSYGIRQNLLRVSYCSIDVRCIDRIISKKAPLINDEWFDKERTVITAGRYDKQKGQWHLIRAFSKVVKEVSDAKLVVFGEGYLNGYYEKLIREYGLEDNIKLYGFSDDLVAYISKCAIFAFPSLFEGFGTALQEALACNVACLATDYISGAREQLSPGYEGDIKGVYYGEYGVLIEKCSDRMEDSNKPLDGCENSIADSIIRLLLDRSLLIEYSRKARIRCYTYDVGSIVSEWENIIDEVIRS